MTRLIISISALIWCIAIGAFSAVMAVVEGLGDVATSVGALMDLVSSGATSAPIIGRGNIWVFVVIVSFFFATCSFWWVVRELVLRHRQVGYSNTSSYKD